MSYGKMKKPSKAKTRYRKEKIELVVSIVISVVLLALLLKWSGVFDKPDLDLIDQHVRVKTDISMNPDNIEEPYILKVTWEFPEGSVLQPSDILPEKYYENGFYIIKDKRYLSYKLRSNWRRGTPNMDNIFSLEYEPRDSIEIHLNRPFSEDEEIPEGYMPLAIERSFRTEKEMLQYKDFVTDMSRWEIQVKYYIELYEEEIERLEKIKQDLERYKTLGSRGRMYADTVQITAPYFLLTVS